MTWNGFTPLRLVDTSYPIVGEPIAKHMRIIEAEDVHVSPMHKVIGKDLQFATRMIGADDTDKRWVITEQNTFQNVHWNSQVA